MKHWYYIQKSIMSDETLGPFSDSEFISLVADGKIKANTVVISEKATQKNPVAAERVHLFLKTHRVMTRKKAEAEKEKRQAAEQRKLQKAEAIQKEAVEDFEHSHTAQGEIVRSTVVRLSRSEWTPMNECLGLPLVFKSSAYLHALDDLASLDQTDTQFTIFGSMAAFGMVFAIPFMFLLPTPWSCVGILALISLIPAPLVTLGSWLKKSKRTKKTHLLKLRNDFYDQAWGLVGQTLFDTFSLTKKLRICKLSKSTGVIYSTELLALMDARANSLFAIRTKDILEVNYDSRMVESTNRGQVSSAAGSSFIGAVAGGVLFGGAGMVAGSVIGSSAKKNTISKTEHHFSFVVDAFTNIESTPSLSVDFGEKEHAAKEVYGTLMQGIRG